MKDSNNEFQNRQMSLLSALEGAEKEYTHMIPKVKTKAPKSAHNYTQRSLTKSYRGKESIFKTPEIQIHRLRSKYMEKPPIHGKWTKYTLNDVSADDMSESTNAKTAFSIIRKLQEKKQAAEIEAEKGIDFKPVFKKPELKQEESNENCSNKKEYNFGEKVVKEKKEIAINNDSDSIKSHVPLDHLQYQDEEDE